MKSSPHSLQQEKVHTQQRRPNAAKNKQIKIKIKKKPYQWNLVLSQIYVVEEEGGVRDDF